MTINRRDVIKRTIALTGYALSASVIQGILSGCEAEGAPDWEPSFFTVEEGAQVAEMAETILPKTEDMVGAKDVYVHEFMDKLIQDCFRPKDQENFKAGLAALNERANSEYGKDLVQLKAEDRLTLLNQLDKEAKAELEALANAPKEPPKEKPEPFDKRPFFIQFKQLTIAGFYTSEEVGTKVLAYDPIPGEYNGCMPYEEIGKAWAI